MRFNYIASAVMAAITLAPVNEAFAWGEQGHKTVGAIAEILLQGSAAQMRVKAILPPGTTLASVSVWADCVKYPNNGYCAADKQNHGQDWTDFAAQAGGAARSYHYTDLALAATYSYATGAGGDVVHGIAESMAVLKKDAGFPNPSHLTETQALWLLVHLVGDIHQPLHVGALPVNGDVKATLGSTKLYPLAGECLHTDWDDEFVIDAKRAIGLSQGATPDAYARALLSKFAGVSLPPTSDDPTSTPVSWANETLAVARDVALKDLVIGAKTSGTCGFGPQDGWAVTSPANYGAKAAGQVDVQLWKAGQRLAAVLKAIWPGN